MGPGVVQGYSSTGIVLIYRGTGIVQWQNRLRGVVQWYWYSTGVRV
jgi:hypothetical protein